MSGPTLEEWTNLRRWWFGSVYEIANIELQRSAWLVPPTPSPHWSYVEFCCSIPDADQLKDALDKGHLSDAEFDLLATLGRAITEYEPPQRNHFDHIAILADPAWHAVVPKAERAREELLLMVRDPAERSYLVSGQ